VATSSMAPIYDTDLSAGRMLTESDLENRSPVVVVGADIVEHLMAESIPWAGKFASTVGPIRSWVSGRKKGKRWAEPRQLRDDSNTAYLKQYGAHKDSIRFRARRLLPECP